ncbi:MAG: STAS domain-containing protein [Xanthomonadales bacterium]|nr:STAS domain-containing protein [Xanthomonadales bacterium]
MRITIVQQEPVVVVAVQGSIDSLTAEPLHQALAAQISAGHVQLVADLCGVQYTSSAGLRTLLMTLKVCRRHGGDFRLASVQPAVLTVLSMSGFTSLLKIHRSVAEAVDSFRS